MKTLIDFCTVIVVIWLPCSVFLCMTLWEEGKLQLRHKVETSIAILLFVLTSVYWSFFGDLASSNFIAALIFVVFAPLEGLGLIVAAFIVLHRKDLKNVAL